MRKIIVISLGFLFFLTLVFLLKTEKKSDFVLETEIEISDMKLQKDSLFHMADEFSKKTELLKLQNDSLISLKPKVIIKSEQKIILVKDSVQDIEDYPVLHSYKVVRNDDEIDRIKGELEMTRWTIYRLVSENDSLLIRLEQLQSTIDSLKKQ